MTKGTKTMNRLESASVSEYRRLVAPRIKLIAGFEQVFFGACKFIVCESNFLKLMTIGMRDKIKY